VRNIFDQYRHFENRVSHALAHAIASDQALTKEFAQFLTGEPNIGPLQVSVQRLPGGPSTLDVLQEESATRSLPDIWLVGQDNDFCCAVENKVGDELNDDQLRQHRSRALALGFAHPYVVAITGRPEDESVAASLGHDRTKWTSWESVYEWLHGRSGNATGWSLRLLNAFKEFLAMTEHQVREQGSEITLTTFVGIPLPSDADYSYPVARTLLRWLRDYLGGALAKTGSFPQLHPAKKRPKVTDDPLGVWDVVGLGPPDHQFTDDPHLTVEVGRESARVGLTVPNEADTRYWRHLRKKTEADWGEMFARLCYKVSSLPSPHDAVPNFEILQRHYPNRARSIEDAKLVFSLDTLMEDKVDRRVKTVEAWNNLIPGVVKAQTQANIQLSLGINYPYQPHSVVHRPEFKDELVRAGEALLPFYEFVVSQ